MKDREFEQLEVLLRSKSFEELDRREKEWVMTLMQESEYESMFRAAGGLRAEDMFDVKAEVKKDLVAAMKKRRKGRLRSLLTYKTPLPLNLITLCVILALGWFLVPSKEIIIDRQVYVKVPVIDTVTIQLPPDTLFLEKKIFIEVPVYVAKEERAKITPKGKSFGESRELQELLVSGQ